MRGPPDGLMVEQQSCSVARATRAARSTEQSEAARRALMRRRPSAPPPDEPSSAGENSGVDLRKLAVYTTAYSLVEGAVTYPYDLVKTRQQMAPPGSRVLQLSTPAYVHAIIHEQGGASLYRGFGWNVLGGVPSEVAYYATYTQLKHAMLQTDIGQQYPSAVFASAGLLADIVGVLLWVPADIISQRMQMQGASSVDSASAAMDTAAVLHNRGDGIGANGGSSSGSSGGGSGGSGSGGAKGRGALGGGSQPRFGGLSYLRDLSAVSASRTPLPSGSTVAVDAASASLLPSVNVQPPSGLQLALRIYQREGPLGLWRGTFATMLSLAPNSAVWWLTHEESKQRLARRLQMSEDHALVHGWSGALAGVTSTVVTNPLDVVKTRLQCSETALSALDVLRGLLRESGLRGLFSGLMPRLAAAVPRSVCTVLAYERAIALCRTKSG